MRIETRSNRKRNNNKLTSYIKFLGRVLTYRKGSRAVLANEKPLPVSAIYVKEKLGRPMEVLQKHSDVLETLEVKLLRNQTLLCCDPCCKRLLLAHRVFPLLTLVLHV